LVTHRGGPRAFAFRGGSHPLYLGAKNKKRAEKIKNRRKNIEEFAGRVFENVFKKRGYFASNWLNSMLYLYDIR